MATSLLEKLGQSPISLVAFTALTGAAIYAVLSANETSPAQSREIVPSPRTTLLPRLSKDQIDRLAYCPTALPGGRDVNTPYGFMRVYEWGPETGRKVLFVHGDGTPSPVFRPIADELVKKGCRVMMFDLWGRGYSDTPADCQHDVRLYGLQIYFALSSSSVAWGASAPFSIVGFSMGGSIVMDFFAHNPTLVESMVLLGPAGFIGKLPSGYSSFWYRHSSLAPRSTVRHLIGTLFGVDIAGEFPKSADQVKFTDEGFTPAGSLQFQFDHHHGFITSFLSTIHYGPLQHQDELWRQAGDIIKGSARDQDAGESSLFGSKILCLCGEDDDIVLPHEVKDALDKYMGGANHFEFTTVPGTHSFVWPEALTIASLIHDFWERNKAI